MPKTEFLQIRLTPEDRERLRRAAASDFIDVSTWARRAILQALARWEDAQPRGRRHPSTAPEPSAKREVRRVAEPNPRSQKRSK